MLPSTDHSIIVCLKLHNEADSLAQVQSVITEAGATITVLDLIRTEGSATIRDAMILANDQAHAETLIDLLHQLHDVEVISSEDKTFSLHLGGKIEVLGKFPIRNRSDLAMGYTPGVARVCMAIHDNPGLGYHLTGKGNMVAVVTDGTAVLGLGDIGSLAGLPVMEGKAMLFKAFAGVDAFPICLDTKDVDEIVQTVKLIAPGFGGINLEDISAPRCFEIEKRLKAELDIPVFHDDQHGTAIVLTAAFINALRLVGKQPHQLKVVFSGVGAAGFACTQMLQGLGVTDIIGCDRQGALVTTRSDLDPVKRAYAESTNPRQLSGPLKEVLKGSDVFIGLSGPGVIDTDDLKRMNPDPIVFAMANPVPEIMPSEAAPYVRIMATGRSDFPNQINNLLAFPGVFRGALDCHARDINESMKLAAAHAIANVVSLEELSPDYIVPSVFDQRVAKAVADAVMAAARESGVARK